MRAAVRLGRTCVILSGSRPVARLPPAVKNGEHELACQLDLDFPDTRPGEPQRVIIATSWVIDSRWVTRQRIPAPAAAA
jgi:hypothetical protein